MPQTPCHSGSSQRKSTQSSFSYPVSFQIHRLWGAGKAVFLVEAALRKFAALFGPVGLGNPPLCSRRGACASSKQPTASDPAVRHAWKRLESSLKTRFFLCGTHPPSGSARTLAQHRRAKCTLLFLRCKLVRRGWMLGWGRGLACVPADRFPRSSAKNKKRGVPRHHGNMLPGNSFPQICVVSVNRIVENATLPQEYLKVVA